MKMIGQITLKASNGYRFISLVIDYFRKWVEAALHTSVTQYVICRFIKKEIICQYRLLEMIILDNATNLNNKMMEKCASNSR